MLVLIIIFSRKVVGPLNLSGNKGYVADVADKFHMSAPLMKWTKYQQSVIRFLWSENTKESTDT
jgi:hypothetical protein